MSLQFADIWSRRGMVRQGNRFAPLCVSEDWGTEFLSKETTAKGTLICLGQGPPDDEDFMCEDTCYAYLCYSRKDGIVGLNGTWAPAYSHFAAEGYKGLIP